MEREPPTHAADEPLPGAGSRGRWRLVAIAAVSVGGPLLVALAFARQEPAFYRTAVAAKNAAALDPLARRMVSRASALHAAVTRTGAWEGVIADRELNAWLATSLPRNHRGLLPRGISEPRVAFQPHRLQIGTRASVGPFSAVAWADVEVWLKGVDQVGLRVSAAGVGGIPVPRDAMLRQIATRLSRAGFATDLRRVEGTAVLVVSPPVTYDGRPRGWRLESLAIDAGELLLAGTTGPRSKGAEPE
jgi:hypothetical protein